MTKAKALVLLYPRCEEMEFDITVGCLRRADINVTIAGPDRNPVTCSREIKKLPEMSLREAVARGPYDVIVLIGGANGWVGLAESEEVGNLLREQERCDRMIAAICTTPIAMKKHGVFYGKKLTSYPTVEQRVSEGGKYIYMKDDVVVDGNLITSRGNFTSFHFALKIVEMLTNKANARETGTEMIVVY